MKEVHYRCAIEPYKNTLKSAARKALYPLWSMTSPSVFLYNKIVNRICTCARSQRLHSPTKLSPYRNTLSLQLRVVINLRLTFTDPASSLECFYMESIVSRASKPTLSPNNGPLLPLIRSRILGVMTSQYGQGNYSCFYHIETYLAPLTTLFLSIQEKDGSHTGSTSALLGCLYLSIQIENVFTYGRGARERSEFYWLKASYFTLKFHPHIETHSYYLTLEFNQGQSLNLLYSPRQYCLSRECVFIWQRVLGSNQ